MRNYNDPIFQENIKNAVNEGKLIVFIGAGISRLCGLPSWDEAANDLLDYCEKQPKCKFQYYDKQRILANIKDAREKITIGYYLLKKINGTDDFFYEWLKVTFDKKKSIENGQSSNNLERIKKALRKLSNTFFSTNIDLLLDDDFCSRNIFYEEKQLNRILINSNVRQLWHIHGSLEWVRDVIFTAKDYLERYTNKNFREGLQRTLGNPLYTILFIGYGCSELQLLDFLVNSEKSDCERMYLLQPYFNSDNCIYDAEEPYYKDYGIQIIQYPIDTGYNFLINVLEEFGSKVESISILLTQNYTQAQMILEKKYAKKLGENLIPYILSLNSYSISYLFFSIRKNNNATRWYKFLSENQKTKYLFSVQNDIYDQDKEPINLKNIRILLNNYVDQNELILKKICTSITTRLIQRFLEEEKLFSNSALVMTTLKVLFFTQSIAGSPSGMRFVKLTTKEKQCRYDWLRVCYVDSCRLMQFNKKTVLFYLNLYVHQALEMNGNDNYLFDDFSKKYVSFFIQKYPKDIYKICYDSLSKVINSSDFSDYYIDGDCFDDILNNRNINTVFGQGQQNSIIKEMIESLIKIKDEKWTRREFLKHIEAKYVFEKRLAIFIVSKNIEELKRDFLIEINRFASIEFYSEIYSLFKLNSACFDSEELEMIYEYIDNLNYGKTEFVDLKNKVDLCCIFIEENNDPNGRFLELKNRLTTLLSGYSDRDMQDFPSPYDRSKIITGMPTTYDDSKIRKKILESPLDNVIAIMQKTEKFLDLKTSIILDHYKDFYDKFNFKNILCVETLATFSQDFINLFFTEYFKDNAVDNIQKIELLKKTISLQKEEKKKLVVKWCEQFFFLLDRNDFNLDEKNKIFDFLFSCINDFDERDWLPNEENESKNIQSIFLTNVFYYLCVLILICDEERWKQIKNILGDDISKGNKGKVAKCAVVYSIKRIYIRLDEKWINDNIDTIFKNDIEGYNYSYSMFAYSDFYTVQFVKKLIKHNIFNELMSSKEYQRNTGRFIFSFLYDFVLGNYEEKYLSSILYLDDIKTHTSSFLVAVKEDFVQNNMTRFVRLLNIICESNNKKSESLFIEILRKMGNYPEIKENCFKKALVLGECGFDGMHVKRLSEVLSKDYFDNSEIVSIIQAISKNIDDFYYNKDDLESLFKKADWQGSENQKKLYDLIVLYRNKDPELASKMLESLKFSKVVG